MEFKDFLKLCEIVYAAILKPSILQRPNVFIGRDSYNAPDKIKQLKPAR